MKRVTVSFVLHYDPVITSAVGEVHWHIPDASFTGEAQMIVSRDRPGKIYKAWFDHGRWCHQLAFSGTNESLTFYPSLCYIAGSRFSGEPVSGEAIPGFLREFHSAMQSHDERYFLDDDEDEEESLGGVPRISSTRPVDLTMEPGWVFSVSPSLTPACCVYGPEGLAFEEDIYGLPSEEKFIKSWPEHRAYILETVRLIETACSHEGGAFTWVIINHPQGHNTNMPSVGPEDAIT